MFGYGYALYRGDKGRMTDIEGGREVRLHAFDPSLPPLYVSVTVTGVRLFGFLSNSYK